MTPAQLTALVSGEAKLAEASDPSQSKPTTAPAAMKPAPLSELAAFGR